MRDDTPVDVESCWNDYLRAIEPDAHAATRVRRGLERALSRRSAEGSDHEPARPTQRAAAAIGLIKSTALSIGLATATLGGLHLGAQAVAPAELPRATTPPPVAQTVVADETPAAIATPAPATIVVPPPATSAPLQRPRPPTPVTRPSATRRSVAAATSDDATSTPMPAAVDELQAEVELMERARKSLSGGDDREVLALLEQHALRFTHGVMIEERRAWTAIAQCRRGAAQAKAIARQFAREYPRSSLLDDVEHACAEHLSTDPERPSE